MHDLETLGESRADYQRLPIDAMFCIQAHIVMT